MHFFISIAECYQTGSGKTHTMIGDAQNRGLIPRSVAKLFSAKRELEESRDGISVDIRVELLEIYNEEVRDLLDDSCGPDGQLIKLRLSSNEPVGNVKVNARDENEVARNPSTCTGTTLCEGHQVQC